jgi:predicted permease
MWNDMRFRLRSLFRRSLVETEMDEELRFHLEKEVEKYTASGMTREEASRRARLVFGGREQIKEDCREAHGTSLLESSVQDVRYAARQLMGNPLFSVTLVLTLALSIGANSAIFSVVDSVLLKSLPYEHPDRIARIFLTSSEYPKFPLNPFDFRDYRARSRSFESMAAYVRGDMQLSGNSGEPQLLRGFHTTAGYFHVLGLNPELGHEFDQKAEVPGSGLEVILSDRLWHSQFGGDPEILGRKITLDARPYTVVGIMPKGAEHPGNNYHAIAYGEDVDIWTPFVFAGNPAQRGAHYLDAIGRLKDGVTKEQAAGELSALMTQLARESGHTGSGWKVMVTSLNQEVVGSSRTILLVLLGTVGMVLLIACSNAANLLLARAANRQREIAVRLALGASRSRLIRQLLTESVLIALVAGALGLAMAVAGVRVLVSLLPADFPRSHEIHVSAAVFLFTFLISVATGILFGLTPAIQASRTDPRQGLHEGGRSATVSRRFNRLRNALVVAEVSLACVLLIGAGLLLRSLVNLLHLDPGFQQNHVLSATLSLPEAAYPKRGDIQQFDLRLDEALNSLPGIESAGVGSDLPWTGYDENMNFDIEGKQPPPHEEFHGRYHYASPDYFRTLGISLLSGRFFTKADNQNAPKVVIINRSMANHYWPNEEVVGKRITFDDKPKETDWFTVVGVVGDVKDRPNSSEAEAALWWSDQQLAFGQMSMVVRGAANPQVLADGIRSAVRQLDPKLAVGDVRLMDQIVDASVSTPRFAFVLVGLFAGLAILLAAIGTYGVIAYSVSQRTSEFGLRMALGAQRADVLRLVLAQAAKLVFSGTVLGIALALALGRVLSSIIYNVSPADPLTFTAVGLMVVTIAVFACYLPARRATKTNPMTALRAE